MIRHAIAAMGLVLLLAIPAHAAPPQNVPKTWPTTWHSDNGNGTYTNPLFYDEFSDPDLIRVGDDYYLTGTTMHSMPGLPILHSKDLVNWTRIAYASDKLDLGPAYRLEDGKGVYGQGIWAPSFRYHNGTFYIFSNVNRRKTQLFTATNPAGPWTHTEMKVSLHDLSVLFDDDGKAYAIWGYRNIHMAELTPDLLDLVPGTEKIIIQQDAGMGEGLHFYKVDGKYLITSAWYDGRMRMPAARADTPWGPYEVNKAISTDEAFGLNEGNRLATTDAPPFKINPANHNDNGHMSLHQGGIVQTPSGQWWGFSMMDYNSVGRLTSLSPVTWQDGWPWFGLPGNLGRTPRTWVKPDATPQPITTPYTRNDAFDGPLNPVWQWSHVPDDAHWSLTQRKGFLRLHALSAKDLWGARNSLTQRAIGPRSSPTTILETKGMTPGDVAGLSVFSLPYAWIGVERTATGTNLAQFDQQSGKTARVPLKTTRVWLRADCDFLTEKARFSYSTDGKTWHALGTEFTMVFQLKTFQGARYALFNYNTAGEGGYADFDSVTVKGPDPQGLMRPIPYGKTIAILGQARVTVIDQKLGRVALKSGTHYLSVTDTGVSFSATKPGLGETFQWIETPAGDLVLMSLKTNRFLHIDAAGKLTADSPGPSADPADGTRLKWQVAKSRP